jgi:16S rRNA U516 pseudouridylate synthase RsuA-like enzyme
MNPAYLRDYDDLKEKVADLFPDIVSGQKSQLINGKLPRDSNGALIITISGDKFYIDSTP